MVVALQNLYQFGHTDDLKSQVSGEDHPHDPASRLVLTYVIVYDVDGISVDKGDPSFHHLTVDQPVINPCKDDWHLYFPERYSAATLICCLP